MARVDLYQSITDRIIAALEQGTNPWKRPWVNGKSPGPSGQQISAISGKAYRGINQVLLTLEAVAHGYQSTGWITPRAAMEAGLNIKGTKCTTVVLWKKATRTERDNVTGDEKNRSFMWMKAFNVLNLDQCTETEPGQKAALKGSIESLADRPEPLPAPELVAQLQAGLGLSINHGGDRAFYAPSLDAVQMPVLEAFRTEGDYLATLAHEAIHASGSRHRLDRDLSGRFGDASYSGEELTAEIGAVFLCGALGIEGDNIENHAAYIQSWLKVLKADNRAIITAASKAQAAADYVLEALGMTEGDEEQTDDLKAEDLRKAA